MDECRNLVVEFNFFTGNNEKPSSIVCYYNEDLDCFEFKLLFKMEVLGKIVVDVKVVDLDKNITLIKKSRIKINLSNEKRNFIWKTQSLGLRCGEKISVAVEMDVNWSRKGCEPISKVLYGTVENRKRETVSDVLVKEYENLQKIKTELYQYKPYRKVFFAIQEKMRQVVGMVHYSNNHCPVSMSEQKYLNRLVVMLGNKIPASVHHAGVNMETGEPFKIAEHSESVSVSSSVSGDLLMKEIASLREEIEQLEKDRSYHSFWIEMFNILKQYELDDDDRLLIPKERVEIEEDVERIGELFKPLGYELKYYEDFEDKESMEAKLFMIDGVFGYPALYYKNGEMVSSGEGKRDQS